MPMRILMAHNYYKLRGGEDQSFESEASLLEARGHHVIRHTRLNHAVDLMSASQIARRSIWSSEDYTEVRKIVEREKIDVLHVQNFFPLISPSVYDAARAGGAAVVQSLRNYRLLCPNGLFFRDGKVCQDCATKVFAWPGVLHGCYRASRTASAAVAAMSFMHRVRGTWSDRVDRYIALTAFTKSEFVRSGFAADRISVKPNFLNFDPGAGAGQGGYAVYVGRLSPEKGIDTAISAWRVLSMPLGLKIIGTGPMESELKSRASDDRRIEFLGHRELSEVLGIIGEAAVLIFPSEWFETFGRVAIESYAKGTPVIAAAIGAVAEVVENEVTGYLFSPGDAEGLAKQVNRLVSDTRGLRDFRTRVRQIFEQRYTADINYQLLTHIYAEAMRVRNERK